MCDLGPILKMRNYKAMYVFCVNRIMSQKQIFMHWISTWTYGTTRWNISVTPNSQKTTSYQYIVSTLYLSTLQMSEMIMLHQWQAFTAILDFRSVQEFIAYSRVNLPQIIRIAFTVLRKHFYHRNLYYQQTSSDNCFISLVTTAWLPCRPRPWREVFTVQKALIIRISSVINSALRNTVWHL